MVESSYCDCVLPKGKLNPRLLKDPELGRFSGNKVGYTMPNTLKWLNPYALVLGLCITSVNIFSHENHVVGLT